MRASFTDVFTSIKKETNKRKIQIEERKEGMSVCCQIGWYDSRLVGF